MPRSLPQRLVSNANTSTRPTYCDNGVSKFQYVSSAQMTKMTFLQIDPIGATVAATATVEQSLKLIRRVSTAIELHKNGNSNLEYLCNDLCSIAQVIELVQIIDELKTKGVCKSLANILKHAQKLDHHVQHIKEKSKTGSSMRRVVYQFMSGPEDLESTKTMVAELTTLKATLTLHIQMAHVGLVVEHEKRNNSGDTHILNNIILQEVNQVVEQRLGKGRGLKIAEVLQGKEPDGECIPSFLRPT